jgi:hypothetical protein
MPASSIPAFTGEVDRGNKVGSHRRDIYPEVAYTLTFLPLMESSLVLIILFLPPSSPQHNLRSKPRG